MNFSVSLHPDVVKYLVSISDSDRKRCYLHLKKLSDDPFKSRSGCDISKITGKMDYFRLRVGNHRFLYIIMRNEILIEEGFKREKGY